VVPVMCVLGEVCAGQDVIAISIAVLFICGVIYCYCYLRLEDGMQDGLSSGYKRCTIRGGTNVVDMM
jgi:hypothetical protein